jgi:predicted transcriptional regulator
MRTTIEMKPQHRAAHAGHQLAVARRRDYREQHRKDALAAWTGYKTTGLHLTAREANAWLARLGTGKRAVAPKCHV